jgi:CheY-like chemotaxis protein/signal transduction histidine kinase
MSFKDQPIRRKLTLLILSATILALTLACTGLALYERANSRSAAVGQLSVLADTVGVNVAPSMSFNDKKAAQEMLRALRAEPHILGAVLYDDQGRIFAEYRRSDLAPNVDLPAAEADGVHVDAGSISLVRRIILDGGKTASILIVSDQSELNARLRQYARISVMVLLIATLISYLASLWPLKIVSDPIVHLAGLAGQISAKEDYSLRANLASNDEAGQLVHSFNEMLEGIQQRDGALQTAKDELESRVLERTAKLQREMLERKQAEAEMRLARDAAQVASRAKSEFLARMSHEIRTPLNGLLGMTRLTLKTELAPGQREVLETLSLSANKLLEVINDILDFSTIEAGKVELEETEFNLRDCLEETLNTQAVAADKKGLELVCDIAPNVPESVCGDSRRLRQILLHLVGNAIKFTDKGEIALRVESEDEDDGARTLHFMVADTGVGIPLVKQESILDAFTQADTSTPPSYGSAGLRLTISSRLVAMMGGRMWLKSEVGRGTQFHFIVRLQIPLDKAPQLAPAVNTEALRGMKVLVVDDNATNRRILRGVLRRWGLRSDEVESGEQALARLASARGSGEPYQLILTDVHMPGMDGFALVEEIRRNPELATTTIMMLTSAGYESDAEHCRRLGISSYLFKPVRRAELLAAILAALGQNKAVSQPRALAPEERPVEGTGLRVLLAEDNQVNQAVASRMLKKMGHSVVVAANGVEAVALVAAQPFDLVLMDIQMPQMDGFGATRKIRAEEVRTGSHLPIIAITAHTIKGDRERCLEAGMDEYVPKPVDAKALERAIAIAMRSRNDGEHDSSTKGPEATRARATIWNVSQALEKLGGDEQLLYEMVDIFISETPKQMKALRLALAQQDADTVKNTAHNLKGELGYMGAPDLSERARALEELGRKHDLEQAAQTFAVFDPEIATLLACMRDAREKRSSRVC